MRFRSPENRLVGIPGHGRLFASAVESDSEYQSRFPARSDEIAALLGRSVESHRGGIPLLTSKALWESQYSLPTAKAGGRRGPRALAAVHSSGPNMSASPARARPEGHPVAHCSLRYRGGTSWPGRDLESF